MRTLAALSVLLVAIACAGQRAETSAAALTGNRCGLDRVAQQDTVWQEVAGDGFTYCVPATWSHVGAQATRWRAPDADFSWGERPPFMTRKVPFRMRRAGTPDPMDAVSPVDVSTQQVVLSETVDGRTVHLTLEHPAGRYYRSATEQLEPALTMYGVARTSDAAARIVAVYRSVRFVKKP